MRQKECYVMRVFESKKKPAAEYQDDCSGEKQERRPTMHQATKAKMTVLWVTSRSGVISKG